MVPAMKKAQRIGMARCQVWMPALPATALDETREMDKMAS
jgi:hypothetical protein